MLDVSQIMKDLASMVHEQGDAIGKFHLSCVCVFVHVCLHVFCMDLWFENNIRTFLLCLVLSFRLELDRVSYLFVMIKVNVCVRMLNIVVPKSISISNLCGHVLI